MKFQDVVIIVRGTIGRPYAYCCLTHSFESVNTPAGQNMVKIRLAEQHLCYDGLTLSSMGISR